MYGYAVYPHNVSRSISIHAYLVEVTVINAFWKAKHENPDDVKGLNARKEELIEVHKQQVYIKILVQQCYDMTGKGLVGTRWLIINKGDGVNLF